MTALEHLNMPFLAKLFAVFAACAAFGIGCATQSNAIAEVLGNNFSFNRVVIGVVLCAAVAIVTFGGVKSIARVCERLVPIMSIVYTLGCLVILIINIRYLPATLGLILSSAFTTKAMAGGFIGSTLMIAARYGMNPVWEVPRWLPLSAMRRMRSSRPWSVLPVSSGIQSLSV
jgi:AGCS family alanine or glycine:cation symporter